MRNILRSTATVTSLVLAVLSIGACDKSNNLLVAGTYTSELNSDKYRELKPDGSCFIQEVGAAVKCTYKSDGGLVKVSAADRFELNTAIAGKIMTDSDGERWVKK